MGSFFVSNENNLGGIEMGWGKKIGKPEPELPGNKLWGFKNPAMPPKDQQDKSKEEKPTDSTSQGAENPARNQEGM